MNNKEIKIPFGAKDSELKGWEYTIPEDMEAEIKNGKIIVKQKESEDGRIRRNLIELLLDTPAQDIISHHLELSKVLAYLEKQKEQNGEDKEDNDFTIYHPLKNGKGEYKCVPYSFYGSLTSFSEDKDLIDFLHTCFYTEEECNKWIEQQKKQKPLSTEETELNSVAFLEQLGYTCIPPEKDSQSTEYNEEDKFLEGELSAFLQNYDKEYEDDAAVSDVARHFYEIGKKQSEQQFTHHEIDESLQDAVTHQMEDDSDVDDFVRRGIDDIVLKYAELGAKWQKEQKSVEWSLEDEKMRYYITEAVQIRYSDKELAKYLNPEIIQEKRELKKKIFNWLRDLHPQSKEELTKMLQDEYNKGKETGEKEGYIKGYGIGYNDATSVMPVTPSGFGCDGINCTNPQMDCINCPRRMTTGGFNTASSFGDTTLKTKWKPSEGQMRALKSCVSGWLDNTDGNLESLYNDLKKL